jgi:hypothetical protein
MKGKIHSIALCAVATCAPLSQTMHAQTGKRYAQLHADVEERNVASAPRLAAYPDYTGPADPWDPSRPAICNPEVRHALDNAWIGSSQAAHRPPFSANDKVEYGFAIQVQSGTSRLAVAPMHSSDLTGSKPNELTIPVDEETIATAHTHNIGARPTPSAADAAGELPAFVRSQFYLYVTIPGTGTYAAIDINRVCAAVSVARSYASCESAY